MSNDKIITDKYHIEVIRNLAAHDKFINSPFDYLVERIVQMFPDYRDESVRQQVEAELRDIAYNA